MARYAESMKNTPDVTWSLPIVKHGKLVGFRKRPFAFSTQATSDLIGVIAFDGDDAMTVRDVSNELAGGFDREANDIVARLVDEGFGELPAREVFANPGL